MADSERTYGAPAEPVVDAGSVSRMAVIGDVHGNAVAFAAVLEDIAADPPDVIVVNGDLSWDRSRRRRSRWRTAWRTRTSSAQRRVGADASHRRLRDGDVDARAPQR